MPSIECPARAEAHSSVWLWNKLSENRGRVCLRIIIALAVATLAVPPAHASRGDIDADGYVGLSDWSCFTACLALSGPGLPPLSGGCVETFDADTDGDVDLADIAAFQRARGHLPIPLKDSLGQVINIDSTAPYSGRETCGGCHDLDRVTNGFLFQQGRTDTAGNLDMGDDYYGDGRWWIKSSGRYGKWGQTFRYLLAAKENTSPSQMDQTAFAWIRDCSSCHPGGGPGEFDRDGMPLLDESGTAFGYELLGKTAAQVALDGDYSLIDFATGLVSLARWDVTGLSGPDCLRCHRRQRTVVNGVDMNYTWRQKVLAAGTGLVDAVGDPVPAFAAASTAGQGWFSQLTLASASSNATPIGVGSVADAAFLEAMSSPPPVASPAVLQVDYRVGVTDGSLATDHNGAVLLSPYSVTWPPKDQACWACHPYQTISGTVWFDERDVLYRYFNHLSDDDPANDVPPENSRVCTVCHPGDLSHNFARGNSPQIQYRDDLDWTNLRHCRSCHLVTLPDGQPNPGKHPDAPEYPGNITIHLKMEFVSEDDRMRIACQVCHIPYALAPAVLFRDITIPGAVGMTSQYLSADPRDPDNEDKSRWYFSFAWKTDADGQERLFPVNRWIMIYWGDWNQNGTPGYLGDDIVSPIATWRVSQLIPQPLPIVTDDNDDGQLEINRPEEILAYIQVLKGSDIHGEPVAVNPVLVKGPRVWFEDPSAPDRISSFEHEGSGIPMTSYPYLWGKDHNVLPVEESLGYVPDHGPEGCHDCHSPALHEAPIWDGFVLVDPYGPDGEPVYTTVRELTGLNPP